MAVEPRGHLDLRDLDRLAASIVRPTDLPWNERARAFIDVVTLGPDHPPLARCTHRTAYQVIVGLDGGRRDVPVGPAFTDRATASALVRRLNEARERDAAHGERPPTAPRCCTVCGATLPPGSQVRRETCSAACRQRLARSRRAAGGAAAAARAARVPRRAVTGHVDESLATPTESVTARATAPATQLQLFATPSREEMAAASMRWTAAAAPEVRDERTVPAS